MVDVNGTIEKLADPVEQLIDRWWEDHFPGSAVAHDTRAWNVAHAAKETLKRLLARAGTMPPEKTATQAEDQDLQGSI
jgi:hypothetical protein